MLKSRSRILVLILATSLCASLPAPAAVKSGEIETKIRQTLAKWVIANNSRDDKTANRVWAPGVKGVFPAAPEFSRKEGARIAGVPEGNVATAWSTFSLTINEIMVSEGQAVVNDTWRETLHFAGSNATATRQLESFEIWVPQPDGEARIVRWISAPDP